jgi:alkanesulfonate monooxygenase SsuD/methylene tetrahydromethanopterin reductase-like flavin-dependent oxidoreductase (luciferase family)
LLALSRLVVSLMVRIGFHAFQEQFAPSELLQLVQEAEAAGFDCSMSSDHFKPGDQRKGIPALLGRGWAQRFSDQSAIWGDLRSGIPLPSGDPGSSRSDFVRNLSREVVAGARQRTAAQRGFYWHGLAGEAGNATLDWANALM